MTRALLIEYEAQEGLIRFPALMVRSWGWGGWALQDGWHTLELFKLWLEAIVKFLYISYWYGYAWRPIPGGLCVGRGKIFNVKILACCA